MAHQNIVPSVDIQVLAYRNPDPVITLKRFVLKHCGVGASLKCMKMVKNGMKIFIVLSGSP